MYKVTTFTDVNNRSLNSYQQTILLIKVLIPSPLFVVSQPLTVSLQGTILVMRGFKSTFPDIAISNANLKFPGPARKSVKLPKILLCKSVVVCTLVQELFYNGYRYYHPA